MLVLPAGSGAESPATTGTTGGVAPGAGGFGEVAFADTATLGSPVHMKGQVGTPGAPIDLQLRVHRKWRQVARTNADAAGTVAFEWSPPRAGRFHLRFSLRGLQEASAAANVVERTVTVFAAGKATWYGPGFYGNRTACGVRLTHVTLGVANRTLPCGTRVAISHGGQTIVVPVIDRGPYGTDATWDLTSATAQRLHISSTTTIAAAPLY